MTDSTSKTKLSIYTAITGSAYTILNGIISLIVVKMVILTYGSDLNGINSSINQLITFLLVIEGGVTLAANVSMFSPLKDADFRTVNIILSTVSKVFNKIAFVFLLIGVISSAIYAFLIKTDVDYLTILLIFLMTILSTTFNLFYSTKYKIVLQADQREYIINIIQIISYLMSQGIVILLILKPMNILIIRLVIMVSSFANALIIGFIAKRKYGFINLGNKIDLNTIKGTKDIIINRVTGVLYSSSPILITSVVFGTVYTSILAVYLSIVLLVKNILYSIVNSVRMSFGVILSDRNSINIKNIFYNYQLIVFVISSILICSLYTMISPFIALYTNNISDATYVNSYIPIILVFTAIFEIYHIPSGIIINMSGDFKTSKRFQLIAALVLLISFLFLIPLVEIYGVLLSVLLSAIVLSVLEILKVNKNRFQLMKRVLFRTVLPNLISSILFILISFFFPITISSYSEFFIVGIMVTIGYSTFFIIINYFLNEDSYRDIIRRMFNIFKSRRTYNV